MDNKKFCQACKKREAYKKLVSSVDGSFFLVCKKKKCIAKIYEDFQPVTSANSVSEFIGEVRWDRTEHQGRSYRQVKGSYEIMDIFFLLFLVSVSLAIIIYLV